MYDTGIENGFVYLEGKFHRLNLYIKNEKICTLSEEKLECQHKVEASTKYILPGFIDPHVHFALGVGENISKDDFYTGSVEAAFGGVTTYIDFLDPIKKAEAITGEFEKRRRLAEKSIIDYSFHGTVANPTDSATEIIREFKKLGIHSVKLFTTYGDTDRRTYDGYIYELLIASKEQGVVILVHAENDELIDKRKDILIKDHEKARPVISETIEVMKLALMAQKSGGNLYIVHVSAGSSVKLLAVNFMQELENHQIILESCPHYFLRNSDWLAKEDGYKYTMTPPLRSEEERLLLKQYHKFLTTIGTDHCPYTKEKKNHHFTSEIPMGIGGIRYSFLNMYNEFGFSILDKYTSGPAETYGLKYKGSLLPGNDADIVIFDREGKTYVKDEMSIYEGKILKGSIETVFARGAYVVSNNSVLAHNGKYIERA